MSGAPLTDQSIIIKYRPQNWDEVIGQQDALRPLQRVLAADTRPHCYLLVGPSGVGKTTIARIIAKTLNAELQEIDAASHSGVDDAREMVDNAQYMALTGDGRRLYLIDECHTLSRSAWQALLKLLEEPPDHFFVVLCTTEPDKVPATIAGQRAYRVNLKPVPVTEINALLEWVAACERWTVNADVMTAILQGAEGSPRKALLLLLTLYDATDREEVYRVSGLIELSDPVKNLCQLLLKTPTWAQVKPILAQIPDADCEKAVSHIGRYLMSVLANPRTNDVGAAKIFETIKAITFPTETYDPKLRLYTIIGRIIWP